MNKLIDTPELFFEVYQKMLRFGEVFVDTETTGLECWKDDELIGISIYAYSESYYFPFRHKEGRNLPINFLYSLLSKYLSNPERRIIGYNYKFDMHFLKKDGVEYNPNICDVMLGIHLLNENEDSFKLKDLADKYIDELSSKDEKDLISMIAEKTGEMSSKKLKAKMNVLTPEQVCDYACQDVILTAKLYYMVKEALEAKEMDNLWNELNKYLYITSIMEYDGIKVNVDLIRKYSIEAEGKYKESLKKLSEKAGYEINPNSSKQICAFLGVKSSAVEVLETLDNEESKLVKECRGWKSVVSRYYEPYLKSMDKEHVLHPSFNLIGTVSGRLSCSNPNLQAVARATDVFKVKDVFIARDGYSFVSADYSQAEMRIGCFYAKEQKMIDMINSGANLHTETAELLGIPRDVAKRINFGVIYGIGANALAEQLHIDLKVAKEYLNKYHNLYPQFKILYKECENFARKNGYIKMWSGRVRHYKSKDETHKAMSNLIQGAVAEVMKYSIINLYPIIKDLGGRMLLQVHDQIMFEIPDEFLDISKQIILTVMSDYSFNPKLIVDIKEGKSWGSIS